MVVAVVYILLVLTELVKRCYFALGYLIVSFLMIY